MDYEHILVEIEDRVAVITMNRPEVLNAMNHKLNDELHHAVTDANANDGVGCIVITGAGERAFSAGGDIHEQRADAVELTEELREANSAHYSQQMYDIAASPKPVLGMMNGLAYGGGAVLASCLDMRVGSENTKFRFLAVAYGRINSTWTLTNQVGWPTAKEFLFTGRVVEAEEAHRVGLLNHLVPSAELRAKTMEIAATIAGHRPESVIGIKQILLQDKAADMRQMWENERDYTTNVAKGYGVEQAFPEFIARRGRQI
jgi:enoyl-CoA hydratase/carnithine racemase